MLQIITIFYRKAPKKSQYKLGTLLLHNVIGKI